jgi:hypothetical protein
MNTTASRIETLPPAENPSVSARETMTPFTRVPRNVMTGMIERAAMMAQPAEVYRPLFGGRVPTMAEKIQFIETAIQRMTSMHIYENNLYHVEIVYGQPFIHLDIHRVDRGPCKNWDHFQQIKNELIGPEHEAVELFPAESRLVNTAHEYHMWVHADPGYRFPFGFGVRWVLDAPIASEFSPVGAGQNVPKPGVRDSVAVAAGSPAQVN